MEYFYLINFITVAIMTVLMYQFPTRLGFSGPWFQELRFVKPLTFFLFLNLPISMLYFKIPEGIDFYFGAYGLTTAYFLLSSLKDKRLGLNTWFTLLFLSFLCLSYLLNKGENYL